MASSSHVRLGCHLGYLYESEIGIHTYNQICTIQASLSVCTELLQSADALEMMLKISLSIKQDDQDIAMATKLNRIGDYKGVNGGYGCHILC
ncbi:hypothetical protein ACP70R_031843 [Stipagrostis hirtigluma subsp. patula]